jgi:hypothetical protein
LPATFFGSAFPLKNENQNRWMHQGARIETGAARRAALGVPEIDQSHPYYAGCIKVNKDQCQL